MTPTKFKQVKLTDKLSKRQVTIDPVILPNVLPNLKTPIGGVPRSPRANS